MSSLTFVKRELAAAIERGVSQCVLIGASLPWPEILRSVPAKELSLFALCEQPHCDATQEVIVPTRFESEALETALEKSHFDKLKATLFVWLGGAGYRRVDAAISSLAYMGSLPGGSGVVLDYAAERSTVRSLAQSALDALASRVQTTGGCFKEMIQPQAVNAMLRGMGFQTIVDLEIGSEQHLVSAVI